VVKEQATRLSRMLSALIDLAETEPNRISWTAVSVQVKDLAATAAEQIRPLAAINDIELGVSVPAGLPTAFGNRDRLIQAAANLLATAVGVSQKGWLVDLSARVVDPRADRSSVLPPRKPRRDPLLPAPETGYELSDDALIRIDVECFPPQAEEDAPVSADAPTRPLERQVVLTQLLMAQRDDEPPADALDPALRIARSVVHHHGGRLWAEPRGEIGMRLSILLPSLVQKGDGPPPSVR
jgi:K+-sensing histidine kinase KdpD